MNEPVFIHWMAGMTAIAGGALSALLGIRGVRNLAGKKAVDKNRSRLYCRMLIVGGLVLIAYGLAKFIEYL